jgi:predicted Zn-dependent protease
MEPGSASIAELYQAAEGGVLVRDLNPAVGNPGQGKVSWSTPWAYKVEKGQVVGRYPRFVLMGSTIEMLNRVAASSAERRWIGSQLLPDIVVR